MYSAQNSNVRSFVGHGAYLQAESIFPRARSYVSLTDDVASAYGLPCDASFRDLERRLSELAAFQKTGSSMKLQKSDSSVRRQTANTSSLPLTTLSLLNTATRRQWQKKTIPRPRCGKTSRADSHTEGGTQL